MSGLVVDTSALVAILAREPGRDWLAAQLVDATERLIAAPTAVELGIVLEAREPAAIGMGRRVLRETRTVVTPFDEGLVERALEAWRRFGKGRHAAALNFGDCCSYALADETGYPLLCVGDDFSRTDLVTLIPPEG